MTIKSAYADAGLHIQETAWTCGPASLLNVLRAKGLQGPSEGELAAICETSRESGTDNDKLVAAARTVGLEVVTVKTNSTLEDIDRHLDAGNLVIVNYVHAFDSEGHFGVVVESDARALYLLDSSLGLVRLKRGDLKSHWRNNDGTVHGWLLALK